MEGYVQLCIIACAGNARYSADEHAQTSGPEHGGRHSLGPPGTQTSQKQHAGFARAGRAAIRRQHPSSLRARRGRSPPRCGELTFGTPTLHRAPDQEPGRILIPADGAAGDQRLRPGLPACLATAATRRLRPVPSQPLPGAMVSGAHASCNRRVTSTSIHMARPGPASAPRGHAPLYADTLSLARTISDRCRIFVIAEPDRGDVSIAPYLPVLCLPHVRWLRRLLAFNGLLVRFTSWPAHHVHRLRPARQARAALPAGSLPIKSPGQGGSAVPCMRGLVCRHDPWGAVGRLDGP
jgi:hypothetical protein